MTSSIKSIHVVGGGLAGSEAAWQLARAGVPVVLHEMRPVRGTEAHQTEGLAELVCSNSFRSDDAANNAVGFELDIITIALLGGVSVFGGRGRLTGVLWALVLVATIRNVLGLSQIGGDAQGTVIGLLLIVSLFAGGTAERLFERLPFGRAPLQSGD